MKSTKPIKTKIRKEREQKEVNQRSNAQSFSETASKFTSSVSVSLVKKKEMDDIADSLHLKKCFNVTQCLFLVFQDFIAYSHKEMVQFSVVYTLSKVWFRVKFPQMFILIVQMNMTPILFRYHRNVSR